MKTISLPYYRDHVALHIEEDNLRSVLENNAHSYQPAGSELELVREALEHPIGTRPLRELAVGKRRVTLITSDHTRAVPSRLTLPLLLGEIRAGNPDAEITILIATGLHRKTTVEEQCSMFGEDIVRREHIVVHDAFDDSQLEYVCRLPSGSEFSVNRLAVDTDLLVCEGFIEPHFFAGFSGGRKSILPGVASAAAVNENHSFKAVAHPGSHAGILHGNVISQDMVCAARSVNVAFILNVALDEKKKVIAAFAGDLEQAHEAGCSFVKSMAQVPAVTGDIAITTNGGYPLDQNLYQCAKAAATAEACAGENGVIILVASCADGIGGVNFEKLMRMGTPQEINDYLSAIPPRESISEQWCVQIFSQMLLKHTIILVTDRLDHELVRSINMIPASTPDEALALALELKGADAKAVVIPDGVSVIAVK